MGKLTQEMPPRERPAGLHQETLPDLSESPSYKVSNSRWAGAVSLVLKEGVDATDSAEQMEARGTVLKVEWEMTLHYLEPEMKDGLSNRKTEGSESEQQPSKLKFSFMERAVIWIFKAEARETLQVQCPQNNHAFPKRGL